MRRPPERAAAPAELRTHGTGRAKPILLAAAVGPLVVHALLFQLDLPLGCPGRFVYLYSPVHGVRLLTVPVAVALGVALGAGVWLAATRPRTGLLVAACAAVGLGVWVYAAPPEHYNQHLFNIHSPSHDGAFVYEAKRIDSLPRYLRHFPLRARTPPEQMRGTRVISNPPGLTLLAYGVDRVMQRWPALAEPALAPLRRQFADQPQLDMPWRETAAGFGTLWVLAALWVISGAALYGVGRLFCAPEVALTFAAVSVFTPATLLLAPGKDTAQLLTTAVPAWLWLSAARSRRPAGVLAAAAAGALLVAALLASLIHAWAAAVLVAATLYGAWRGGRVQPVLLRALLPAAGGFVLATAAARVVLGLDLVATMRAVAASQAEVTRGPDAMPLTWQMLGIPLFLLFAGTAFWALLGWWLEARRAPRPEQAGVAVRATGGRAAAEVVAFGRALLLLTAAVLLGTVGFTNIETPRLWIPLAPLVLLGAMLQVPWLRGGCEGDALEHQPMNGQRVRSRRMVLAALVAAQVGAAAVQWSLMDMREAETRVSEQRFFE